MTIQATYHGEVRVVRSSYTSKTGPTLTLALHDIDELNKVQGMDGKRYMLALVEIGDDEQPVQEKPKGGALSVLAARWCLDKSFQNWIRPIYSQLMGTGPHGWGDVTPEDFQHMRGDPVSHYAAHAIKVFCNCESSRSEIDNDPVKAQLFQSRIRLPYMKHMAMNGVLSSHPEEVPA